MLFAAAVFVIANLAVDLVSPLLDPRIVSLPRPRPPRPTPRPPLLTNPRAGGIR